MINIETKGVENDTAKIKSKITGEADDLMTELFVAIVKVYHELNLKYNEEFARENVKHVLEEGMAFAESAKVIKCEMEE